MSLPALQTIDLASSTPRYAQLQAILKQRILSGGLKPGERIPGERQLAEDFGLALMTVRQAVGLLVQEGFLERRHGRGTYVLGRPSPLPTAVDPSPPIFHAPTNRPMPYGGSRSVLFGRAHELNRLSKFIKGNDSSFLSIVGGAGVGKTRLALTAMDRFGAHFVDQATMVSWSRASHEPLFFAVARALGFALPTPKDLVQELLEFLREKQMLLVLDNLDKVPSAVLDLTRLANAATKSRVLVTTRQTLDVSQEEVLRIDGLNTKKHAVDLFMHRIGQLHPEAPVTGIDQASVAGICEAVRGVPLAIELASACAHDLPFESLLERLQTTKSAESHGRAKKIERRQGLRNAVLQAWALLNQEERSAFEQMGVFEGGFDASAAEAVCHCSLPCLDRLTSRFFVQRSPRGRYHLHDVLRAFALEKLEDKPSVKEELLQRHRHHYLKLLQQQEDFLDSTREVEAMAQIRQELENVRSAWGSAIVAQDQQTIHLGAPVLALFYHNQHMAKEADFQFGRALSLQFKDPETRRRLLIARAPALFALGNTDEAVQCLQEALAPSLHPPSPDPLAPDILCQLADISVHRSQYEEATQRYEDSLRASAAARSRSKKARALSGLGTVFEALGRYEKAEAYWQRSLELYRERGAPSTLAKCLKHLGLMAICVGDYQQSRILLEEGLQTERSIGSGPGEALALHCLSILENVGGQHEIARQTEEESLAIFKKAGAIHGVAWGLDHLGDVHRALGNTKLATELLTKSQEIFEKTGDRQGLAYAISHLGMCAVAEGKATKGARLLNKGLRIRQEIGDRQGVAVFKK